MDHSAPSAHLRARLPLFLMAAIAALPPLAVDMYLPAFPQIAGALGTGISSVQNSLSVFLLGFGLGMLLYGPMSDRYGRKPLALFGLCGFAAASFLLALSASSPFFLTMRFIQGFLGSAATIVIPAMIRDCYGKDTARGMSAVAMIMLIAPLVAPLLGSLILSISSWEGIFVVLGLYPALLLVVAWRRLPETKAAPQAAQTRLSPIANYRLILSKRSIYPELLCFVFLALSFFTYLTSVSFVFITFFGVGETAFGFLFALSASALILANYINVRMVSRHGPRVMLVTGLGLGALSALALFIGALIHPDLYWAVFWLFLMVGSIGLAWVNTDALVLIEFPDHASSASAVTGTLRFGFGSLAGPLLAWLHDDTIVPVTGLLLVGLCIAGCTQIVRWLSIRSKKSP